jgi:hypothetical protein
MSQLVCNTVKGAMFSLLAMAALPQALRSASPPENPAPRAAVSASAQALAVARYGAAGQLLCPDNLDEWVFLGTGLGMDYTKSTFDIDHPGSFQVVLMEPTAYRYFKRYGRYADGSMFLLSFYAAEHGGSSIDRRGFVPGGLTAFEIHIIDRGRFNEGGHAFFSFDSNDQQATRLASGNDCVSCHVKHGAFDGTFAQFYAVIRARLSTAQER